MPVNYKLTERIIENSVADQWDEAKLEWGIEDIYWESEQHTCLCGHFPINELCFLRNHKNNNRVLVGNQCVKKFMGLDSDKLFSAIKRVAKDPEKALNPEAIEHAHRKGWINQWERDFCFDTFRKRKLTQNQINKRVQINKHVLACVRNAKG